MADPRIRRDIWSLESEQPWHPITNAYALAVGVMRGRDSEEPTSWAYQAAVHGLEDATDDFRNQCQHNTWFFLPWHRMYLYWFERIVRAAMADLDEVPADVKEAWALPYWDYSRGDQFATLPPALTEPEMDDGRPNPLFDPRRRPRIVVAPEEYSLLALNERTFAEDPEHGVAPSFGGLVTGWHHFDEPPAAPGALEQTPHNVVHGRVGGRGGDMSMLDTAPLDPVFWLHHANIDRLWVVWLGLEDGRANPTEDSWLGFEFNFHDENSAPVQSTASQVLETTDLGYTYESTGPPEPAPEGIAMPPEQPPEPPPDRPAELVGATDEGLTLTGQPVEVHIPLEAPQGPLAAEGLGATPARVYLNVEGIQGEENPGFSYAVYLNVPEGGGAEPERHHVGNVSFFGIERVKDLGRDHPGGHGLRYAFDVTDVVSDLSAKGRWDPDRVKVTLEPLGADSAAEGIAAEGEPPPVHVGRISLFYK